MTVKDSNENIVWEINHPYEIDNLMSSGFLSDYYDVRGLEIYLKQAGDIPNSATLKTDIPRYGSRFDNGGSINNRERLKEYFEERIRKQIEEEKGKTFSKYRINVYEQKKSGGYPFASHETDNFLSAVEFAKENMKKQRAYRPNTERMWASISKFIPVRERGNTIYPYSDMVHFGESDMENMNKSAGDGDIKVGDKVKTYFSDRDGVHQVERIVRDIKEVNGRKQYIVRFGGFDKTLMDYEVKKDYAGGGEADYLEPKFIVNTFYDGDWKAYYKERAEHEKELKEGALPFENGGRTTFELEDDSNYSKEHQEAINSVKRLQENRDKELIIQMKIATIIGIDEAIRLQDSDYLINPINLIHTAVRKGFIDVEQINKALIDASESEAYYIDSDYRDSGHGIGSSDMNAFIRSMLRNAGIQEKEYAGGGGIELMEYDVHSAHDNTYLGTIQVGKNADRKIAQQKANKRFGNPLLKVKIKKKGVKSYAEGGKVIDTFTAIQGSTVMPNNPFTIEKENDFYVIKNSKGEVLAKDTTKEGIMNDKGMFLNLYAKGGALKPIPEGNKGLPKLPKEVRNRMGYMKDGGSVTIDIQMSRTNLNNTVNKLIKKNGSDINKYSEYDLKTLKSFYSERYISEKMAKRVWGLASQNGFNGYASKVLILNSGIGNILEFVDNDYARVDAVNPDKKENIIAGLLNEQDVINIHTDSIKTLNKYDLGILLESPHTSDKTKVESLKLMSNKLNSNNLLIFVSPYDCINNEMIKSIINEHFELVESYCVANGFYSNGVINGKTCLSVLKRK